MTAPPPPSRPPSIDAMVRESRPEAHDVRHAVAVHEARALVARSKARNEVPAPEALSAAYGALAGLRLRRAVNATGILLHTNLGRAPLDARWAAEGWGYGDVELDLATGERGHRTTRIERLARALWEAPAAMLANNNAAALILAVRAVAAGAVVVVSRGESVQIGGGFRVPSMIEASGARLVEVGTANITTLEDYEAALDGAEGRAALLRVHRSNFALHGHVASPSDRELAALARKRGVPFVVDQGSGATDALAAALIRAHGARLPDSTVEQLLRAGVTLLTFSGDKLLGGPQCGFVLGDGAAVGRAKKDPLARAFRLDKTRVAALERVLGEWARPEPRLPFYERLMAPVAVLRARAAALVETFRARGLSADAVETAVPLGGGATPQWELPSAAVRLSPAEPERWFRALLRERPPVLARRDHGALLFDLRSVGPDEDELVARSVAGAAEALR